MRLVSAIGPVEHVRPGWLVKPAYDPTLDEFTLTAITGTGKQRLLASWTELYRDDPEFAREALIQRGAELVVSHLPLLDEKSLG